MCSSTHNSTVDLAQVQVTGGSYILINNLRFSMGNSVHRSLRKDNRADIDEAGRKVKVSTYTGGMLRVSVVACTRNPIKSCLITT